MNIKTGIKGTQTEVVGTSNSAKTMGSGTLDVYATPAMIALMEKAAWESIDPYLDAGEGTVGIKMDITHDAPTPFGMSVTATSELVGIDGRRLIFEVMASDERGQIGSGRHERFIIQNEKFQKKANKKGKDD